MKELRYKPHQLQILQGIVDGNVQRQVFDVETGLGKTILGLSLLKMYPKKRILVITKALLVNQAWHLDNGRFSCFGEKMTTITSKNIKAIEHSRVCICSFAIFRTQHNHFKKYHWDMVIIDESHRMGKYNGPTTRAITGHQYRGEMCNTLDADMRILMSGTPIPNHRQQVFPQLQYIGYPKLWREFQAKYFYCPDRTIPGWMIFRHSMTKDFNNELLPYMTTVTKRMAGMSDEKVFNIIPYKMPEKVMEFYEKMRTEGYAKWDGKDVTIDYKLTEGMRLRQISKGYIKDVHGDILRVSDLPMDMFKEYIKDRAGAFPYIVAYQENPELADIETVLKSTRIPYVVVNGQMSKSKREGNIELFKSWTKGVLVGQAESISEGLSVNNTNRMYIYSLDHNLRKFSQLCDRLAGIERGMGLVPHYDIPQCVDTIDEVIYNGLLHKRDILQDIRDHTQRGTIVHG